VRRSRDRHRTVDGGDGGAVAGWRRPCIVRPARTCVPVCPYSDTQSAGVDAERGGNARATPCLSKLTQVQRSVVVFNNFADLRIEQIAGMVGLSPPRPKSSQQREGNSGSSRQRMRGCPMTDPIRTEILMATAGQWAINPWSTWSRRCRSGCANSVLRVLISYAIAALGVALLTNGAVAADYANAQRPAPSPRLRPTPR
jgi:hypothetical protein